MPAAAKFPGLLLAAACLLFAGCGQSGPAFEPPENPTPLPSDDDVVIQLDGSANGSAVEVEAPQ